MLTPSRWFERGYGRPLSRMGESSIPALHSVSASSGKKRAWQRFMVASFPTCSVWYPAPRSCSAHTRVFSSCLERAATCNDTTSLWFRFCSACTTPGFALEWRFGNRDLDVVCYLRMPHHLCFEYDVYTRHFYDDKRTRRDGPDEGLGLWHLRLNTIFDCMNLV
jgi:hypothetical protein